MTIIVSTGQKYRTLPPTSNERMRRLWAGTEARALGCGGIAVQERLAGLDLFPDGGEVFRADILRPAPPLARVAELVERKLLSPILVAL